MFTDWSHVTQSEPLYSCPHVSCYWRPFNSQASLPAFCSLLCLCWSDLLPTEALSFYFHDQNVGTKRQSHPRAYNPKKMPQMRRNVEKTLFIHCDFKIRGMEQRWSTSQAPLQVEKAFWLGFLPEGCRDQPAHSLWSVAKHTAEQPSMLLVSLNTIAKYLTERRTGFILILGLNEHNVSWSQDFVPRVWRSQLHCCHILEAPRNEHWPSCYFLLTPEWEQCEPTFKCGLPIPIHLSGKTTTAIPRGLFLCDPKLCRAELT